MDNLKGLKIIDWQLSLTLANSRSDVAHELLNMLVNELPQSRIEINQAYETKDYETLQQHVHKLHGATCYIGVPRLKEITKTLEDKLKKLSKKDLPPLLSLLNQEIENLILTYDNKEF